MAGRVYYGNAVRNIGTAKGPAASVYRKRAVSVASLSQPVCRVCGSHTVGLYADYGVKQVGSDGLLVIAFCVECMVTYNDQPWHQKDETLTDTVDRSVFDKRTGQMRRAL